MTHMAHMMHHQLEQVRKMPAKPSHPCLALTYLLWALTAVNEYATFDKAKEAVALFTVLFLEDALDDSSEFVYVQQPGDVPPMQAPDMKAEVSPAVCRHRCALQACT